MGQKSNLESYIADLEVDSDNIKTEQYFWPPRSGEKDLQPWILRKLGISDHDLEKGRTFLVINQIKYLISKGFIPPNFSVIDICCGDAIILMNIKKAFPDSSCYGVDVTAGDLDIHEEVKQSGVCLNKVLIQDLFESTPPHKFDLILMINSYRNWEWNKELRNPQDKNIPQLADKWFESNSKYTILTVTSRQINHLKSSGFKVHYMGRGESQSAMTCLSVDNPLPFRLFSSFGLLRYRARRFFGRIKRQVMP